MLANPRYNRESLQAFFPRSVVLAAVCAAALFSESAFADPAQSPYAVIGSEEPLAASSRFVVVDDFNSGKFALRQGATWRTKQPALGALDLSLDSQDARSAARGYSMKAVFNLAPREQVYFETFLDRIDVSQTQGFVFKVKAESSLPAPFLGSLRVTFIDWRHKKVSHTVVMTQAAAEGKQWDEILVPVEVFNTLDLDQLVVLRFSLLSHEAPVRGVLRIDEMAFFGGINQAFENNRDNLVGFPSRQNDDDRKQILREERDDGKFLRAIAEDTWKFFINAKDKHTHLIVDHIRTGENPLIGDYTSTTNIAMDFFAIISAMELGFISREEAKGRAGLILAALERMAKYEGFFYNFYDIKKLSIQRSYISTVDAGWLAISLVVVRQAFPDLRETATRMLDGFNFSRFLDPENNQLVVGMEVPARNFGMYHYGLLATEARAMSFYGIGKGDLPREHWWYLYRTPPESWKWQKQKPKGAFVSKEGVEYFAGYYKKKGKKFVPPWGGSLFEVLMPTLVLREREMAPRGLGLNNRTLTALHRDYALLEKKYPVWGISPCADTSGRTWQYLELGVPDLGAKGYPDRGVLTPHVSFLALDTLPQDAILNIRKWLDFPIYGEYGFYDALNVKTGIVNPQYLSLDQGMILAAICNYLRDGALQKYFHSDPIAKKAETLLTEETFFKN